jgi:hypothetical protein
MKLLACAAVGRLKWFHWQLVEGGPLDPGWGGLGAQAEATNPEQTPEAPPAKLDLIAGLDLVEP